MSTFSDRGIKALAITGKNYRVFEGGRDPGFGVQVTAAGTRSFFLQYAIAGKRRFLNLGTYPGTGVAIARQRAREARALVERGIDPQTAAADKAAEARRHGSIEQLADAYITHLQATGRRSAAEIQRALRKDVLPHIGTRPALEITPADIRDLLYRIISRGARVESNRVRSYLHGLFAFGLHHDNDPRSVGAPVLFRLDRNPVAAVPKDVSAESADDRALSWDEIRQVWHATELDYPFRLAVRLLLATGGQRSGEVTRAPWPEFDLASKVWWLPAARAKNKREHGIPLTDLALDVLTEIRGLYPGSVWLFPARHNPEGAKPWNEGTLAHAVQAYCVAVGMTPWAPKDLRRTAKTRMGELGISKLYRDLVQNHVLNDVSTRHYDRYDYLTEKRGALARWCGELRNITA